MNDIKQAKMKRFKVSKSRFSFATVLGSVLVALKLTGYLTWSWWWITFPFWYWVAAFLIALMVTSFVAMVAAVTYSVCDKLDKEKIKDKPCGK